MMRTPPIFLLIKFLTYHENNITSYLIKMIFFIKISLMLGAYCPKAVQTGWLS
jgi:hypothetical protein